MQRFEEALVVFTSVFAEAGAINRSINGNGVVKKKFHSFCFNYRYFLNVTTAPTSLHPPCPYFLYTALSENDIVFQCKVSTYWNEPVMAQNRRLCNVTQLFARSLSHYEIMKIIKFFSFFFFHTVPCVYSVKVTPDNFLGIFK